MFLSNRGWVRSGCLCILLLLVSLLAVAAENPGESAIDLYDQGNLTGAQAAFEVLEKQQPDARWSYYLGRINAQQGDLETAAEYMEEAVGMDDTSSLYHQKLGEYYGTLAGSASIFKQMGLAKKSKSNFERAVELDGSNLDARSGLLTYYLQAPGIAGGSEEKAEEQAIEIGRQDPARGHFAMAQVRAAQGDEEAAEREYRIATEVAPENSDTWVSFGIYLTGKERYDEALAVYRQRLDLQPDDMAVTYQFGRTVSISGISLEEGRDAFVRYTTQFQPGPDDPGLDWAHYRLGLIYSQLDEREAAASEYRTSLEINPDHPEAKKALRKMN